MSVEAHKCNVDRVDVKNQEGLACRRIVLSVAVLSGNAVNICVTGALKRHSGIC